MEEFEESINYEYRAIQAELEKASPFISETGDSLFRQFVSHLIEANLYAGNHCFPEEQLEYREGEIGKLLREDDPDLDWEQWNRDYHHAKTALRNEVSDRLNLLSIYEQS